MAFSSINSSLLLLIVASLLLSLSHFVSGEVIDLDSKNFEHLTQASTGATTGDWLVKFYASWCGHCKKLEPIYEKVAEQLDGEINVARVNVPANRELGTRFGIKGFPTIKFISKGQVYQYKGRRTVDDIVKFARGDYQIHEAEAVTPPLGLFGEIMMVYQHAYKKAGKDLQKGSFFTMDVFLTFLPFIFVVLVLLLLCAPIPQPQYDPEVVRRRRAEKERLAKQQGEAAGAGRPGPLPPTSEVDDSMLKKDN